MALAEIVAVIADEGEEELARVADEVASERAAILRDAEIEAQRREREEERALDARLKETVDARRIAAENEAMRIVRAARERAYDALLSRLRDQIEARWKSDARRMLAGLLSGACSALPDAKVVRVHQDDEALTRELVAELAMSARVDGSLPERGVVLDAGDGRRVDNTVASRMRAADSSLRQIAVHRVTALGG